MTIETAAAQLAELIKASSEWKNFQTINETFENDEEISQMLGEYRQLVAQVQGAHAHGQQTANEMRKLEQIQIRIQQNPFFQQREQAADQMLAVLSQANAALTVNLGLDFAANAKSQQGGGCCGGGEGGGCGCG
jgi:cell fate (sporulation/competence/biofilm development) regulator YlbF (YheA/YmcA/DUF963 family)